MHNPASLPLLAPVAAFLVLLELSVGTVAVAQLVDVTGRVGRGFVGTTALICAAVMAVALLIGINIPSDTQLLNGAIGAGSLSALLPWCLAFTFLLLGFALFCGVGTDAARRVVGGITLVIGAVAIAKASVAFGSAVGGAGAAAIAFIPATLVAGGALAGMLLGHWYLVVPNMSFRPLRQVINIVFATVGLQTAVIAIALGLATAQTRDQLLSGDDALPFWLLVVGAGIVFTVGVGLLTRHFARIRANQPATAMLYVLIISVTMGVVPAHLLFFVTGVPV